MKKRLRIKCKLVLLLGLTMFLTGCGQFEYPGKYPELYSVAIGSILGQRGYVIGPPGGSAPITEVLEEDNYGRVLFSYNESNFISTFSYVIMQRVDGDYAYFYPHYNFISRGAGQFTEEEIERLKDVNSWNQPMSDSSEFERVRIVRQKERGSISGDKLNEVFHDIFLNINEGLTQNEASRMIFLRTDNYGRTVYVGIGHGEKWDGIYIVVLFQPDHTFDIETGILMMEDRNNYQTELRLFMEANGWNEPWEE